MVISEIVREGADRPVMAATLLQRDVTAVTGLRFVADMEAGVRAFFQAECLQLAQT
jgi:hypothetical protein